MPTSSTPARPTPRLVPPVTVALLATTLTAANPNEVRAQYPPARAGATRPAGPADGARLGVVARQSLDTARISTTRLVVAGTLAMSAYGAVLGWRLADDDQHSPTCIGGQRHSTITGAAAGALAGVPVMLAATALERRAARLAPADTAAHGRRPRAGWPLVRWKVRATVVNTAGYVAVGSLVGSVAGVLYHAQRPRACRGLAHAVSDASAYYAGGTVGLALPFDLLFNWPR